MQLTIILVSNALLGLLGYWLNKSDVSHSTITIISIITSLFFVAEGFVFYKERKRYLLFLPALSISAKIIESFFLVYAIKYNVLGITLDLLYGGTHIYTVCSIPLIHSDNYIALKILNNISLFAPWLLVLCGISLGRKINKEKYLSHLETKKYQPLSNASRIVLTFLPTVLFTASYLTVICAASFYEESSAAHTLCSIAINLYISTLLIQPVYTPILNRSAINEKHAFRSSVLALFSVEFISLLFLFTEYDFKYFLIIIGASFLRIILFSITYSLVKLYNKHIPENKY